MGKNVRKRSYFRTAIDLLDGYTPGEQPKTPSLIKLNTNENPYPPSPKVQEFLRSFDASRLRLYPQPLSDDLRVAIADVSSVEPRNVLAGNGSDDILTIITRSFAGEGDKVACANPSYSLYPVLAGLQGATTFEIQLNDDFSLPDNADELAKGARILFIARPNAPTGNSFPYAQMERLCSKFDGILVIDEAYADFADDNCLSLARTRPNVIVCRTMSKSYSLAGARVGWAIANADLVDGMMKVKDSYNVNRLSQMLAVEAIKDVSHLAETVANIRHTRVLLTGGLAKLGFKVCPSQSNFVFASPPGADGEGLYIFLRRNNILVRHFPSPRTMAYVRISIGTPEEMEALLSACGEFVRQNPVK